MPLTPVLSEDQGRQSLLALQAADLRVATVAYRLAAAGTAICPNKSSLTGLTLHDSAQYALSLRQSARLAFGLNDKVAVLAVAPESPAQRAGLRAGDAFLTIGGARLRQPLATKKATYAGVASAYALLEASAAAGPVQLDLEREGRTIAARLVPIAGCASRLQLLPRSTVEARADGSILSITTGLLDFVADDNELALVIAHEMAHNALGHRALLKSQGVRRGFFESFGGNAAKVRETERAADRLGYFLMARAGFDLAVAPAFWVRLYHGPAKARSRSASHPDARSRIDEARQAVQEIAMKRSANLPLSP